jgi:predicted ATP-dependent endonuclease of OLD family
LHHRKNSPPDFTIHFNGVHLAHLRLRDFRNYARLDADFAPGFHLLLGDNAQGKTNLLKPLPIVICLCQPSYVTFDAR